MSKLFDPTSALALGALGLALCASPSPAEVWTQLADMPGVGRHHPVTFVLDGYGYVATGSVSGGGTSDDFYRYDPSTNMWETLPDFPGTDRSYSYGGTYNGKGYLGFGLGGAFLNDLWEYDPVTEEWTQLASLPGLGRTHPAFIITDDGKIFVGTGGAQTGNLRDWWEYDIASNTWTQRQDLPGPARHHPFYFNIGNVPYVAFGHGAGIFRDVYRFDRTSLTWTRMADLPGEGRVAGTQFSFGGKGYVLSGQGQDHDYLDTGEFWEYDPTTDTWTQLLAHPGSGRWAPGSFVIDNVVYLMAGTSTVREEHDLWKFEMPTTGVDPLPAHLDLVLYPNPVVGSRIHLQGAPEEFRGSRVLLLGPDGRRLSVFEGGRDVIELPAEIPAGRYFVSFTAPGGKTETRQITVLR